jgi:hypothetical protein
MSKWVVGYFYFKSDEPLYFLGSPEAPTMFTAEEAHAEAERLNARVIEIAQEDAFNSIGEQIWAYAALPAEHHLLREIERTKVQETIETLRSLRANVAEFEQECGRLAPELHRTIDECERSKLADLERLGEPVSARA